MENAENVLSDTDSDDIEHRIEINAEPKIFTWYINFEFSKYGPYTVIIFWICIILIGIFYGFDMLNLTVMSYDSPPDTDGSIAHEKMLQEFESRETTFQHLLYFNCPICATQNTAINTLSSTRNGTTKPIMSRMSAVMQEWLEPQSPFIAYSDYYTTAALYSDSNGTMSIFADYLFVSESHTSAIGFITFDVDIPETENNNFFDAIENKCADITHDFGEGKIKLSVTSVTAMARGIMESTKTDIGVNCLLLVPVALCVLASIIRSWRLMLIPVACFILSLSASFSLLKPFALHVMDIHPFAPAVMAAMTIAMSIDYSLFLLSRFEEEMEHSNYKDSSPETVISITREAVKQSTRWSGKVVALSGCILSLTFFGLMFYPMNMIQSISFGSGLAIICTILANLTFTPSIILIFPIFFSKFGWTGCPCEKIKFCNRSNDEETQLVRNEDQPLTVTDVIETDESAPPKLNSPCDRCWFNCASKITVYPCSILIVIIVYTIIAPFGFQFLDFEEQLDDKLMFPRDSPYLQTYVDVSHDFSAGFLAPWNILIMAKNGQKVYANPFEPGSNMTYLTETGLIINETIYKCYENEYYLSIEGIGYIGAATKKNKSITYITPQTGRMDAHGKTLNTYSQTFIYGLQSLKAYKQVYQFMISGKISDNRTSSFYAMNTEFDPFYENAIEFVDDFRKYLYSACDKYGYKCYLSGGSVGEVDMVREIYANFAWILTIVIATVFCLMGCVFKSVFVPFRLFATIAIPLSFVFGLSVMVYQNGLLSFLGLAAVADTNGVFWLIPIMTLSILIGLALDYDIFLYSRIYEYRIMAGIPTNEAIVRGVYKTGAIITAAGVIMAISFGGLLLSQVTALCQTGFILVVGVLIDTFVIRTTLVPAIVSIAKEVNWWPGKRFEF